MQVTKILIGATMIVISTSALADAACEKNAKTRDDFLACTKADTDRMLSESGRIYSGIRKLAAGDKLIAVDRNYEIWIQKFKYDCAVVAYSFNDWSGDYSPDTDFQVSACRWKVASQELDFYKRLACPGDMETSIAPKCAALNKALGKNR
ncbi:hypothetical protein [Paraburkholderia sacchari]|uniref:hypothetical protein n=1 Tax=Paraburkholderia sacchari TaxID=159450 RepID=UPI001BD01833|nr:hypothetical protein [Paraburkholderia sacchari]